MTTSVLDYLEATANAFPNKTSFEDGNNSYTFRDLVIKAKSISSVLIDKTAPKKPVVVYMEKGAHNVSAFLAVVYAGCFYVPIDKDMPADRVKLIIDVLSPACVLCESKTRGAAENIMKEIELVNIEDCEGINIKNDRLDVIRRKMKTTDLLYVLFTSGSTGIPKGVTISHAAVIDFMEWICDKYMFNEKTSLCNQAPFYFDASVPDLYIPLKTGATVYIPPKSFYTFPKKVLQYLEDKKVNTLIWVPSALCNVVNTRAFETCVPQSVSLVIFCGEVMPCKHLNVWRSFLPKAQYVNMYGPTEATYACMYYDIDREYRDDETLPLGKPCENCEILLIDKENKQVEDGEIGELCILGECLSQGYYNNRERTDEVFTDNPLNVFWAERMYRTGDLARISASGNMEFCGRKDFQIKRLGHRIELGEIESAACATDGVMNAACVFAQEEQDIILIYTGEATEEIIKKSIKQKLMPYMLPSKYINLKCMPMNINGKIDREELRKLYG